MTLDKWIAEAYNDPDKEGECSMMSLVHAKGMAEQEIHTVKFGTGKKWTPVELGNLFNNKATNYAHDLSGVQLFYVLAFYGGRSEPQARKPFRVNGQTDLLDSMGGTEGPTGTGLTQQAMRHMESVYQLSIKMQSAAFGVLNDTLRMVNENQTKIMRENADFREIVLKMMLEKSEREFNREVELTKLRRNEALWNKGLALGPAILNQLTGSNLLPQATHDTQLIETILENISEDAIRKLIQSGAFPPVVMALLAERGERYFKDKKEREESMNRVSNNGINAEKEVSGN